MKMPIRDVEHHSPAERAARGKDARTRAPRSAHATWKPQADRGVTLDLLQSQDTVRMADLVPIRWGRMLESPFSFFRGAALIMASDLATTPNSGIPAQICGDAHLSNFGAFDSPERQQVFDVNDFDETLRGPWEWDVKRMAASFEIGLREREATPALRKEVVLAGVEEYRSAMATFAGMRNLDVWYARLDIMPIMKRIEGLGSKKEATRIEGRLAKARSKDSLRALAKLTETVNGQPRFRNEPPLLMPVEELLTPEESERFPMVVESFLKNYRATLADDRRKLIDRYRFSQMARKVVGVGSVGTRAFVVLMLGRDDNDPLFLQLKEANASVLEACTGPSRYRNHGRRVVEGQRLMQAASDVTLGWFRNMGFDGREHDYYVRQLWDGKASIDPAIMPLAYWSAYARLCGWTLARAHARSGDRIAISAYLGTSDSFARAVQKFSVAYADQNEQDYESLLAAEKQGRIVAQRGV